MWTSALVKVFTVVRGLVYSAAFIGLWAWLAVMARGHDARLPSLPLWLRPAGVALCAAGMLVAALCIAAFITRGRGTPAPFDPPREFVASGPYRYVRNPMYIGAAAGLVGAGLAVSSLAVVILACVFLACVHLLVVFYEEPALDRAFGERYQQYRSSVHRWQIRLP
jgi:protein-S-isoprenylcysteine O-methyltransferase Ste14